MGKVSTFLIGREVIRPMGDCNTLKTFPNPHHCDPHLDQTKYNDLLPLTIDGVLVNIYQVLIICIIFKEA